jgi:hypothetical protein
MHSAVMQNKKYVEFAKQNTVEVIAIGSLDQAVQKQDPKASAFMAKDESGQEVAYMLNWPNLTYEEMLALNRSPAGQFNKTGKIPYTSIVNPHTGEEWKGMSGGQSGKGISESCEELRKELVKQHGKGVARKDLEKLSTAEAAAKTAREAKDYSKAIEALAKFSGDGQPEAIATRVKFAKEGVIAAAEGEFKEIESLASSDAMKAKKDLPGFIGRAKGTGFDDKAKELMKSLASGNN